MANASQQLAEMAGKTFSVDKERKWGPNGAWLYFIAKDDGDPLLEDESADGDLEEAGAEMVDDDDDDDEESTALA